MPTTTDATTLGMVAALLAAATLAIGRGFDQTSNSLAGDLELLVGRIFEAVPVLLVAIAAIFILRRYK